MSPDDKNPPGVPPEGGHESSAPLQDGTMSFKTESSDEPGQIYFPPLRDAGFKPLPARAEPGARRRRQGPLIARPDSSELDQRLESMARRAAPTFDFFLFSLLAGVVLGVGYLFDAPAILFFGLLFAPILAPWVGTALAVAIGEMRFFGQTLGGFFTALFIVFVTGLLAGLLGRLFMPLSTSQLFLHTQIGLFDLLLAAGGAVALAVSFVRSEEKPTLVNLMVVYALYLPASAAGFSLGAGLENLWVQALLVLLVHLAVAVILGLAIFYYMGFRPLETADYALMIVIAAASAAAIFAAFSWGGNVRLGGVLATPTPLATSTPTDSPVSEPTPTRQPRTPTRTSTPTMIVTPTPTSLPTPVYGRVGPNGAHIRDEPQGTAITTLEQGYLVEILPEEPAFLEGTTWVRVRVKTPTRDVVGWVRIDLIATATPSAGSVPVSSATAGSSPTSAATLGASGSYAVVNISESDATLNVREAAGTNNPLVGGLAYNAVNIGRIGAPVDLGASEWWQIQKDNVTGWVNATFLTEYLPSETFCADPQATALLTDLGTALKNSDGAALAALISPRHGLDVRLASGNAPINYSQAEAADLFTSITIQNWGQGATGAGNVGGTFKGILLPKLLDVYSANYELDCNDTSKTGPGGNPWPSEYRTINFYSVYKPATNAGTDWRDFLVGIEYVDDEPYLFALVHFERLSGP